MIRGRPFHGYISRGSFEEAILWTLPPGSTKPVESSSNKIQRILVATVSVWGEGPNFSLSLHCNPKGGKIGRFQMHSCLSVNAGIRFNLSFLVAGSCE